MTRKHSQVTLVLCALLLLASGSSIAASLDDAKTYYKSGYYKEAYNEVEAYIRVNPTDPKGYSTKANILLALALNRTQRALWVEEANLDSILECIETARKYSEDYDRTYLEASLFEVATLTIWGAYDTAVDSAQIYIITPYMAGKHTHEDITIDAWLLIASSLEQVNMQASSAVWAYNEVLTKYNPSPEQHYSAVFGRARAQSHYSDDVAQLQKAYMDIVEEFGDMVYVDAGSGATYTYTEAALYTLGETLLERKERQLANEVFESLIEKYPDSYFAARAQWVIR
ncbi:MAG: tetratricopeptide repeat protein [Limnochordia bacterium]|jgi:hypothetical protein|nr:MAG: hypothetical protein AA931_08675 [Peptococcaceae bacterium 1109]